MADDEALSSVSSLRSRFEQLATSKAGTSPSTPSLDQPPSLRPSHTGSELPTASRFESYTARQSRDVPRDQSQPVAPSTPRETNSNGLRSQNTTLPRGYAPQNSRQRPLSVHSTFSAPRSPPTFRVESPRSPPKRPNLSTLDIPSERTPNETGLGTPSTNSPFRTSRPTSPARRSGRTPPPPPPISPRNPRPPPVTSYFEEPNGNRRTSLIADSQRRTPLSPALQALQDHPGLPDHGRPRLASPPPIPTRSTKPKIPAKPAIPTRTRPESTSGLAPVPTSEDHVSPFSTPPSSCNNSPSRSEGESPSPYQPRRQSVPTNRFNPPPLPFSISERRNGEGYPPPKRSPAPPPPPLPPASSRMSLDTVRPRMRVEESIKGQRMSLDEGGLRPELPPRPPGGLIGGVKARVMRGRSYSPPRASVPPVIAENRQQKFLPPPKREMASVQSQTAALHPSFAGRNISGSSTVSSATATTSYTDDTAYSAYGADDSDDGFAEDQSRLSEYPDSSQANRRKPYFKKGPHDIPCKSEVRLFAVCGQYVCTISHSTKVWDVETGRCIMALPQVEGTRVTALAFKPSANVQDEGSMLWLGTSHGELMEVDIPNQRIVDTRSSAHTKKEVIAIHRCGYELWSLDESGKLQVWAKDQVNGEPNMRNSPTTFRINPRYHCSIVVDGLLWVGSGKTVDVYQPSSDPTKMFNVSTRPLSPIKQAGEITCCAVVNSEPDKVYFGHSDGKVSAYSRTGLTCVDVVSVSLYKINSMSGVGDYLWAGFKTGMIYVYDVRTKPWRALKDWQCCDGPIQEVVADRTSIWKVGRLQVVSLGTDNIIRVWDGMLEDDWLEADMSRHDVEFCEFREIKALVCTWNAGATKPQDLLSRKGDKSFLQDVLGSVESPDIIVFGFQELVDLEDKKITAKSFLKGKRSKKKRAEDHQEHMSHQYRLWQQQLTKSIEQYLPDESYTLLHAANLVGLFTCIFIKASERKSIRNVCASTVKRGLGGLHGNKGALVIRFFLDDSSLCFINCHLAAGQSHTVTRNNDIAAILESGSLIPEHDMETRTDMFVGGGDGSMILDHEICILNGDLNYRIDLPRDSCVYKVKNNDLPSLLERDQLLMERKKNPGFRLRAFNEMPLTFAPTYKYDVGSDDYDTSEKKRVPAWCDRLLYRGLGRIKQTEYRRWEVRASDHRPVSGSFFIRLKTVNPSKRKIAWEQCIERYEEVKAKHVWEAEMDFLVAVCGYKASDAKKALERRDRMEHQLEAR